MKRYADKTGGLIVEKTEPIESIKVNKQEEKVDLNKIKSEEAMETLQSYQIPMFSINDSSSKGKCKFCGKDTAFSNRHVCVECWKKNKDYIIEGLKSAVKDVEFKID